MEQKEWLTVSEASEVLEISERQVINRINQGKLKAKRAGRRWLIHKLLAPEVSEVPERSESEIFQKFEEVELLKRQNLEKDAEIERLRHELEVKNQQIAKLQDEVADSRQRSDTIILQLTQRLGEQQQLLEYRSGPFWRRWFKKKKLEEDQQA